MIIDEKLNLFKVRIMRRETEVETKIFLGNKPNLRAALENKVRDRPFARLCMSDRCISIFGKTYSTKTGYSWDFSF